MKDFIVNEFGKIITKACVRFGKENGLDKTEMQIVFRLNQEDELEYVVLKKYEEWKSVSFNEILGVKIDFKGYGMMVPNFIKNLLVQYSVELDKPFDSLRIMSLAKNGEKENEVVNCLYYKNNFIQVINLEEIL